MRQASPPGGIWGGPGLQTRPEAVATAVAGTGCVGSRQKHSNKYMTLQEEITRRRTFAVIAHPDAGKTTLTEKLLLFGGAIHVAGAVKSNKIKKGATSDFMEIERQRGISVATSVMGFEYEGCKINILDTPGHEDFAEDTYRTLTAVDSVIIVIDGAKGVESQTRKLMEVCRMRSTPVIVFINKLDRPSKEPFDLLDEVEKELRIRVRPLAFPISNGPTFRGVYNLYEKNLSLFTSDEKLTADAQTAEISDLASPELDSYIGAKFAEQLRSDVELVEGVYDEFDREAYLRGEDRQPQTRGGKGLRNYRLTEKTGLVAGAAIVDDTNDVMLIESGGVVLRTPAASINLYGRDTQGVILMRIEEGNRVIGVEAISNTEETEESGED